MARAEGARVPVTTWLVTGSGGQLGTELLELLTGGQDTVVGVDRGDLDVTDRTAVHQLVGEVRPDIVVNCAAYTAVDRAESDPEAAMAVNGAAPGHLASAVAAHGSRLLHVSTDYVFAGDADRPYAEDAPTSPQSVYGVTKLAGERAVLETLPLGGFVVRTAWLYGAHGPNFVSTMLRLAEERDTVDVVDDQLGQPTWARDLAAQLVLLARSDATPGVYHGTSSGAVTWFGLTRKLFRLCGLDPDRVRPTTTAAFPRPAPRPAYSVLGHERWALAGLTEMRPWDVALAAYVESLRSS